MSFIAFAGGAAGTPGCDPDNGGLKLPQGFCAAVIADNVGKGRHLVVASNGDLFLSLETGRGGTGGGVVALRDTDGDGKMDKRSISAKAAPPASPCATVCLLRDAKLHHPV